MHAPFDQLGSGRVEVIQRQREDGGIEIALEGELDLSTAPELRDALFAAIDGRSGLLRFERDG